MRCSMSVAQTCTWPIHSLRAYLLMTLHLTGAEFENINTFLFLPVSTSRLREIQQAIEDDEILQVLKAIILRGWPDDRSQLPEQTTPYFSMRDELSVHDSVIFRRQQIVVPVSLRKDMKGKLLASHLGTESFLTKRTGNLILAKCEHRIKGNDQDAQWWEHSSPVKVAWVQFPDSASYVGWVCWFSTLHQEVFSGYSGFPLSTKKPTFDLIGINC